MGYNNHMKTISARGTSISVCDCHYEKVNQYTWYMAARYAARQVKTDKGWRVQFMHRLIMNTPAGFDTDHINEITTDNRCSNLRIATRSQNKHNAGLYKNNTSGYKGVSKRPNGSFVATIYIEGKSKYLGFFWNYNHAVNARKMAEKELLRFTV